MAPEALDPAVMQKLLASGDEVSPPPPPSLGAAMLHVALEVMKMEVAPPPEAVPKPKMPPLVTEVTGAAKPKPPAAAAADAVPSSDEADEEMASDPEEALEQEARLEERVRLLKRKEGLESDRTLKAAFKLMDCLIGQYKLNRTDDILREFDAACAKRGGEWSIKHLQSTAFVRWKQYRFKEALKLFLKQQEVVGASAALCENIGHTYSSMGDLKKAEEYFERAIELLKRGSYGNKGGTHPEARTMHPVCLCMPTPVPSSCARHARVAYHHGRAQASTWASAWCATGSGRRARRCRSSSRRSSTTSHFTPSTRVEHHARGAHASRTRALRVPPHTARATHASRRPHTHAVRTPRTRAHRAALTAGCAWRACRDHVQQDSSIIAKAHMSVGKCHEKLGATTKAASHMADALAIFRRTVGGESPLTANAMACLGKVRAPTERAARARRGLRPLPAPPRAFPRRRACPRRCAWSWAIGRTGSPSPRAR